jgi:hypothetical protein
MRMGMTQRIHRNAGAEIQIAIAIRVKEPRAFAALETDIETRKGR